MQIIKKDVNWFLFIFLFIHLFIWTLIPSISNNNLPLDTIEALNWGNELQLGYDKSPPLFPLFTEFFYFIFGNQDWSYYLLSQIFVISAFFIIFKLSQLFLQNQIYSLLSVLLLEGIYFYNFTTPELNAFLCQFPFLAATAYYGWKSINQNKNIDWFLFGIFAGLAALSYYLSFYLLASLGLFFIYIIIKEKKFNLKYLISLASFFVVLTPHLVWIIENNFISIQYALFRSFGDPLTGLGGHKFFDHIFYPLIFLGKQFTLLIPFFVMFFFLIKKIKIKINYKDKKLLFLITIALLPIILMFFTSLFTGARIRTMWMTSFYLFMGVFFVYVFQKKINLKRIKNFFLIFFVLFFLSPAAYFYISISQNDKRTDYPGRKISQIVQIQWNNNFSNEIDVVAGDGWINGGWYAGNLSYHLKSRPIVKMDLINQKDIGTIWIRGYNEITDCKGIKFQIAPFNDICMFGKK